MFLAVAETITGSLLSCDVDIVEYPGAPNENIVQNHTNIALSNVFQYLNGRYGDTFIP